MTGKEKIMQYLEYKGIKKSDFYHKTGFSNGFLDSGKHIGTDNLKIIISKYPDLSLEWFVMDKGNMIKDEFINNENDINLPSSNEIDLYREIIVSKNKEIESKQDMINSLLDHINTLKNMSFLGDTHANAG